DSIHDGTRMQEPALLAMRSRITLIQSEELANARPRRQAIVDITTRDGRSLSKRCFAVRGTADNPMTQGEIDAKALDLIAPVLGASRAKAIVREIARLESVSDIGSLRRLWKPQAKASTPR